MDLNDRIRLSLSKRASNVVTRRDLSHFGSPTQLSNVLASLTADGELLRVGEGIYLRPLAGDASVETMRELAMEVLQKAGVPALTCEVGDREILARVPSDSRHRRRLEIHGLPIRFTRMSRSEATPARRLSELPTRHVAQYVRRLATAHSVSYQRSRLDAWAEGVTHAAGDQVSTDQTDGLLIRLKQDRILDDRQFAQLVVNHHREVKGV